jgi:hypothetical protein
MATAYKNGQVAAPAADVTSYATLYTTTSPKTAVISTIVVCNTSASNVLFRIGLMGSAGTPAVASGQFIAYDATVAANDTLTLTIGLSMSATQFLRVSAGSTAVNFTAAVAEVS